MTAFGITPTKRDGVDIVTVTGDIDIATAPSVREKLLELLNSGSKRLVVDLMKLDFIDSTGLGVLVVAHKAASARSAQLRIAVATDRILKLFTITGLTKTLDLRDSVEAALEEHVA